MKITHAVDMDPTATAGHARIEAVGSLALNAASCFPKTARHLFVVRACARCGNWPIVTPENDGKGKEVKNQMAKRIAKDMAALAAAKRSKLVKIANARVPRAVHAISLLGNLGAYAPADADVSRIQSVLNQAVDAAVARMHSRVTAKPSFTL